MSFVNGAVDLDSLPRAEEAPFHAVDRRYPRLVLGVALLVETPVFLAGALLILVFAPIPLSAGVALVMAMLAVLSGIAWHTHRAASVIRYAVRQHDVILQTGVFWRKETVQPLKRIQHVEQVQGPLDKRLGLTTLRLYSAGTGHVTFQIPGLDAEVAARISTFILDFAAKEDGGAEDMQPAAGESERPADD